ncbi:MAG: ECF-type sigma factor [Planctomycetota bacterium JB042]
MDLTPSVYDEMRVRAAHMLLRWKNLADAPQLSSLVDQTYLRMIEAAGPPAQGREHFLAMWTRAMRWVLVDLARARQSAKRGDGRERLPLDESLVADERRDVDEVIDVHQALETLAEEDERDARIVELRYYGGLSWEEIARALGGGDAQALRNEWRAVKASLRRLMKRPAAPDRLAD